MINKQCIEKNVEVVVA